MKSAYATFIYCRQHQAARVVYFNHYFQMQPSKVRPAPSKHRFKKNIYALCDCWLASYLSDLLRSVMFVCPLMGSVINDRASDQQATTG